MAPMNRKTTTGPQGQIRPASDHANAVLVARILTGEAEEEYQTPQTAVTEPERLGETGTEGPMSNAEEVSLIPGVVDADTEPSVKESPSGATQLPDDFWIPDYWILQSGEAVKLPRPTSVPSWSSLNLEDHWSVLETSDSEEARNPLRQ